MVVRRSATRCQPKCNTNGKQESDPLKEHPSNALGMRMNRFFRVTHFTFTAQSKHREMIHVGFETILIFEFFGEGFKRVVLNLDYLMTVAANEMMVMWVAMQFVFNAPAP